MKEPVNKDHKIIYCVECAKDIEAILVSGRDVYPHRPDLYTRMFWKCPNCGNFVGTHFKTGIELGCIPDKKLKSLRRQIHAMMDPIWRHQLLKRGDLYAMISKELGYTYHTGEIRSLEEANRIINIIIELKKKFQLEENE